MTFFIECILRVSAILAVAFLAMAALRRQSAALRHLIWSVAFTACALAPVIFSLGPRVPLRAGAILPVQTGIAISPTADDGEPTNADRLPHSPVLAAFPFSGVALAIWAAGVLALVVRTTRGSLRARELRRTAAPLDPAGVAAFAQLPEALFKDVQIVQSDTAAVAMTMGLRAPLILLPRQHAAWSRSRLQSVLLHELAHVRRRDCLTQWLPQAICALHWFNPLAWLARSQMLCESERACDDAVLHAGATGPDFARDLFEIAQLAGLKGADFMPTIVTKLERRITGLLDPSIRRAPLSRAGAIASAAAALALLLPITAIRAQNATQNANGTATLSGVVSDPTGAVIANAVVHLTGPSGKLTIAANPAGAWTAQGLAPGIYQVEVAVPGFETYRQANVEVAPGASIRLKQPLAIGQVAESLTVTAPTPARAATIPEAPPQRIRVGGVLQAAKLINKTPPVYPDSLRQQGVEGRVLIQAIVGKSGSVLDAHAVGGQAELADAALAAVRTWQFEPTLLNGEPVEVITTITVNFQLR
jgi:TonB family protein